MATIIIKGIRQYDGEYPLDDDQAFNAREWRLIKQHSGYMPLTVSTGFAGHDPDLFVALAVVAMTRAGKVARGDGLRVAEELAEVPYDGATIVVQDDVAGDDAIPPALTSEPVESSPTSSLAKQPDSGESSRNGSDLSDATPSPTTPMRSVTS